MGSFGQGVGRAYISSIENLQYKYFSYAASNLFKQIAILYFFVITLVVPITWHFFDARVTVFISLLLLYSYIFGVNDIAMGLHNLARNRRESALAAVLEQATKIGFILAMISYTSIDVPYVIVAFMLASLTTLVYQSSIKHKLQSEQTLYTSASDHHWRSQILSISGPASFWGSFVWMQQASDKWALQFYSGSVDVAVYSVVYQISYAPFLIVIGLLMTFFMPMIYSSSDHRGILRSMLWFIFSATIVFAILATFFSEKILFVISGEDYIAGAPLMPIMIIAAGLYQAGDVLSSHFMRIYQATVIMKVKITTSIICVALHFIGAYLFGLEGVAIALLLFGLLYFSCFLYYFISKERLWCMK